MTHRLRLDPRRISLFAAALGASLLAGRTTSAADCDATPYVHATTRWDTDTGDCRFFYVTLHNDSDKDVDGRVEIDQVNGSTYHGSNELRAHGSMEFPVGGCRSSGNRATGVYRYSARFFPKDCEAPPPQPKEPAPPASPSGTPPAPAAEGDKQAETKRQEEEQAREQSERQQQAHEEAREAELKEQAEERQRAEQQREQNLQAMESAEMSAANVDVGHDVLHGQLSLGFGIGGAAGYAGSGSEAFGLDLVVRQLFYFLCQPGEDCDAAVEVRANGLGVFAIGDPSFLGFRYGGRATLWYRSVGLFWAVDENSISGSKGGKDFSADYLRMAPGLCTNFGVQKEDMALLLCGAPAFPTDDWKTGGMAELKAGVGVADIEIEGWYTPAGPPGTSVRGEDWAALASFGFRLPW